MTDARVRLLGLGDNTVDIYADKDVMYPGGNAVNVAVLAGRLGAETGYLGCLGNDVFARLLDESMTAEGVDFSRCRHVDGENAHVLVRHRNGDREFMKSTPGVRGRYGLGEEDFAYIRGFDVVHTSYCSDIDSWVPLLAKTAKRLSYDFADRLTDERRTRIAPHVDIAFLSYSGNPDDACVAELQRWVTAGPRLVVMTRGNGGALACADGVLHRQDALPATVVDTLGAGDAFIAGFLTSLVGGEDVPSALLAGARNAAAACGWPGGFGHGVPIAGALSLAASDAGSQNTNTERESRVIDHA